MSIYLDTRGLGSLAIAVCDRCGTKHPIGELQPDPNSPGLRVCSKDRDLFDPYRLPARQTENITLRHPRPDVPIGTQPYGLITEDGNSFIATEDGDEYLTP
jgi:hypothetical protein